jgi:hypothetical protein
MQGAYACSRCECFVLLEEDKTPSDANIQRLPGLEWFHKCESFMDELEAEGATV